MNNASQNSIHDYLTLAFTEDYKKQMDTYVINCTRAKISDDPLVKYFFEQYTHASKDRDRYLEICKVHSILEN